MAASTSPNRRRHLGCAGVTVVVDELDAPGFRPVANAAEAALTSMRSSAGWGRLVSGDHRGHRVADEPDRVGAEGVLVMADRQHAVRDRELRSGEHEVHPGVLLGAPGVDADDARMRQRRPQQAAVDHPRQRHVVGKHRLPGDLRPASTPVVSDDVPHLVAPRSTASMICR